MRTGRRSCAQVDGGCGCGQSQIVGVGTGAASIDIVAVINAGPQGVGASPTIHAVVAAAANQIVVAAQTQQDLVAGCAGQGVGAAAADDGGLDRHQAVDTKGVGVAGRHADRGAALVGQCGHRASWPRDIDPVAGGQTLPLVAQGQGCDIRVDYGVAGGQAGVVVGAGKAADVQRPGWRLIDVADGYGQRLRVHRLAVAGLHNDIVDIVAARIGGGFKVGRRLETQHAIGGTDGEERGVGTAHDRIAQHIEKIRVGGRHHRDEIGVFSHRQCGCRPATIRNEDWGLVDQRHGLVRKAQKLDVAHSINAIVGRRQQIVVRDGVATVRVPLDGVLRQVAPIDRSVQVALYRAIQYFTYDLKLTRVDGAAHQLRLDVVETVHREQFDCCVLRIAHADADVEPAVAIDDVVATLALKNITAATAEQNVGRGVIDESHVAIAVAGDCSRIHDHGGMRVAIPAESGALQVADQLVKAGDAVDARLQQQARKRLERAGRIADRHATSGSSASDNLPPGQLVV